MGDVTFTSLRQSPMILIPAKKDHVLLKKVLRLKLIFLLKASNHVIQLCRSYSLAGFTDSFIGKRHYGEGWQATEPRHRFLRHQSPERRWLKFERPFGCDSLNIFINCSNKLDHFIFLKTFVLLGH